MSEVFPKAIEQRIENERGVTRSAVATTYASRLDQAPHPTDPPPREMEMGVGGRSNSRLDVFLQQGKEPRPTLVTFSGTRGGEARMG